MSGDKYMGPLLLIRYGEIFLKGLNRPYFLKALQQNIKLAIADEGARVWLSDSRFYISGAADINACALKAAKVFGVHSVSHAFEMAKDDYQAICDKALELMRGKTGTFKVQARRSDKAFFKDSPQINAELGEHVLKRMPHLSVDVRHPDTILSVEIRDHCYLYTDVIPAVGGMPSGTNGRATLLLSGGIDSPVAGYLIAKRGVKINCVYYHSYPFTGDRVREKVINLAGKLSEYSGEVQLSVIPFTRIQTQIHEKCAEAYTTLIMRRFMMRIAAALAVKNNAQALVTGESIGQVASQTMEALVLTDALVPMPVFRPLIGLDKQEIINYAQKIGTFDISSLPYQDCCTVFTPRHPVTHPQKDHVELAERVLDTQSLIDDAIEGLEVITVNAYTKEDA